MKRIVTLVSIVAGLLLSSSSNNMYAGEISKAALADEPLNLLEGRITIKAPAGSKVEVRGAQSIMGAAPSTRKEARIVLDKDKEKLVVMVYELFQLAGDDFEKQVRKTLDEWQKEGLPKYTLSELKPGEKDGGDLKGWVAILDKPKAGDSVGMALLAFVVLPDKTVQMMKFMINKEVFPDFEAVQTLSLNMLKSAHSGSRKLELKGGDGILDVYSKTHGIGITLPPDCVITRMDGPDFKVFAVHFLNSYGEMPSTLSIYYGEHPAYQYEQAGYKDTKITKAEETILGQKVELHKWSVTKPDNTEFIMTELMIKGVIPNDDRWIIHAFFSGSDDKTTDAMLKIVRGLKLAEIPAKPSSQPKDGSK